MYYSNYNYIKKISSKWKCSNLTEEHDIEAFPEAVVWSSPADWQEEFKHEMFNENQQYAADDGDGEEREKAAVVEDGQTEALLIDALVKTFLLVKVDVDQILQVPGLVVVLDLLRNWFLNIKTILALIRYKRISLINNRATIWL